jgi:hypothetical protein
MEKLKEAEWSKASKEAEKAESYNVALAKVWEIAPVHFRDDRTVTTTMLESQRNIHERK